MRLIRDSFHCVYFYSYLLTIVSDSDFPFRAVIGSFFFKYISMSKRRLLEGNGKDDGTGGDVVGYGKEEWD